MRNNAEDNKLFESLLSNNIGYKKIKISLATFLNESTLSNRRKKKQKKNTLT